MNVIVIDVPDAWGMLMSRKSVATLSGSLHMDLSYETIPIGNGGYFTLYNHPMVNIHVKYPKDRNNWSEDGFEGGEICDEPCEKNRLSS
jgi:hypothetical protein